MACLSVLHTISSFHEDITEQLKGTTEAAAGCDLDQSAMDRTIIVAIADEETRTAL